MIEHIMKLYDLAGDAAATQRVQTAHRLALIEAWQLPAGARVLEVGCGQGDMSVALATTVGPTGYVLGVDIAPPTYGGPETLGQAWERILATELAPRMAVRFDCDLVRDAALVGQQGPFDYVVLAHCLWYFADAEQLTALLATARTLGRHLLLAEWSPLVTLPTQLPHWQAATLQAICEAFRPAGQSGEGNIRTLLYPADIQRVAAAAGWQVARTGHVHSPDLQDGQWEVWAALDYFPVEIHKSTAMPPKLKELLLAQLAALESVTDAGPLPVFWAACDS